MSERGMATTSLQALRGQHHQIIQMSLLGKTNKEIAEITGVTSQTVSNIMRSAPARAEVREVQAVAMADAVDMIKEIKEMAPKALAVMESLMDDADVSPAVRLRAATDLLDRAGFGAVKKMDVHSTSVSLTAMDLEEIKKRAFALNPNIVDVTP